MIGGGAIGANRHPEHLLILRHLLQQLFECVLGVRVIALFKQRFDRRQEHFSGFGSVSGVEQGTPDQRSHLGVLRLDFEDLIGNFHRRLRLTHCQVGSYQKGLDLDGVRRFLDSESEELEHNRRPPRVEELPANRDQKITHRRFPLNDVTVEPFCLVQLSGFEQHRSESIVDLQSGGDLLPLEEKIGETKRRDMIPGIEIDQLFVGIDRLLDFTVFDVPVSQDLVLPLGLDHQTLVEVKLGKTFKDVEALRV